MRLVPAGVLILTLATATGAIAARTAVTHASTHNRVTCTWHTELGGSVICEKSNKTGLRVLVSQRLVWVQTRNGKVRFWRNQPSKSPGFKQIHDPRITVTETHNRVTCYWTALNGGGAFCNESSLHGYVAGVSQGLVYVANETSKTVFLANQP